MKIEKKARTVLVVDDDHQVVEMLKSVLEATGYIVVTAMDGITALKTARTLLPDLVLLDLVLPEMDGFSVCEALRRDRHTTTIPIIMLTGLSSELNRYAGLESGANDYFAKPVNIPTLKEKIQQLLAKPQESAKAPSPPIPSPATAEGKKAAGS